VFRYYGSSRLFNCVVLVISYIFARSDFVYDRSVFMNIIFCYLLTISTKSILITFVLFFYREVAIECEGQCPCIMWPEIA
jgi:hypothetical protein